jgi:Phage capsid family
MLQYSTPNIENLVRDALTKSVGDALDGALFSTTAADASRPAGLLVGVSPLTPSSTTPADEERLSDLSDLVQAVSAVTGNNPIVLIAAPAQAASLRLANARIGYEVLASGALADRTVVAVASNALVSAMDPAPRFELSKSATVHTEDTSPAQLASVGTPNTVAAPMRSMFQSDSSALRLIMEVSWGLRTSGAVAWMQNVNW